MPSKLVSWSRYSRRPTSRSILVSPRWPVLAEVEEVVVADMEAAAAGAEAAVVVEDGPAATPRLSATILAGRRGLDQV
jgi:hypothetical protein